MIDYQGQYCVWGPPGTGKTTFLTRQLQKIAETWEVLRREPPVIVVSMTRTAAAVIAERNANIPAHRIGTMHAIVYRMLDRPEIAETQIKEWNKSHPALQIDTGLQSDGEDCEQDYAPLAGGTGGTELYAEYSLHRARLTPLARMPREIQEFAAKWEEWKKADGVIDFSDLIEIGIREFSGSPFKSELIIGDEQQDQSAAESKLFNLWGEAAGASIRAGDPWQALYTWRGAEPDAFYDRSLGPERRRVLKQSHRVPGRVHAVAMKWAERLSNFEAIDYRPKEDARGDAYFFPYATWRRPEAAVSAAIEKLAEGEDVMFCAPCGYMLDPLVAHLRKRGVPFANPWRTRQGAWNPLARRKGVTMTDRMMAFLRVDSALYGEERHLWTMKELAAWAAICQAKTTFAHGAKAEIERMKAEHPDRLFEDESLISILDPDAAGELLKHLYHADLLPEDPARDIHGDATLNLLSWLETRISAPFRKRAEYLLAVTRNTDVTALKEPPMLYVGTIHSFKGAEADHVIVIPDLSTEGARSMHTGALRDDVIRMFYVALTRAKKSVTILRPADRNTAIPLAGLPMTVSQQGRLFL